MLPNFQKPKTTQVLLKTHKILGKGNVKFLGLQYQRQDYPVELAEDMIWGNDNDVQQCDLLLSIGGDGTMIANACYSAHYCKPIVGINTGTLGYLTEICYDELETKLPKLLSGTYQINEHHGIEVCWNHEHGGKAPFILNDLYIRGISEDYGLKLFSLYCDHRLVEKYRADSYLISTPTGSTAYSYSFGGPVLEPAMSALSFQAVGAQLGERLPLVFSLQHEFTLSCDHPVNVWGDGKLLAVLLAGESLTIAESTQKARFISLGEPYQIQNLRKKLWYIEEHGFDA